MFSPRSTPRPKPASGGIISPAVASRIAVEYASLKSIGAVPRGIYVTPSTVSISRWEGVMFVRDGPYAGAVLRFSLIFEHDFPRSAPRIKFDTNVYHHPKSKEWTPRGNLARWQPGVHHVFHLLHAVATDFTMEALESVTEEQAINKQLHLLYRNSNHTFLSMTAQRSLRSASRDVPFPNAEPEDSSTSNSAGIRQFKPTPDSPTTSSGSRNRRPDPPSTPTKQSGRVRLDSGLSSISGSSVTDEPPAEEGQIRFSQLKPGDKDEIEIAMRRRLWDYLPLDTDSVHAHDTT